MKKLRIISLVLMFLCCSVVVFAVKSQDVPPWMENVDVSGRSTYLIPKGAKRRVVGSQIIVEPPNEYVARRLYEIERSLEKRFKAVEDNQKKFKEALDAFAEKIERLELLDKIVQDFEELNRRIEGLEEFKAGLESEDADVSEEGLEEDEIAENLEDVEVEEENKETQGLIVGQEPLLQ